MTTKYYGLICSECKLAYALGEEKPFAPAFATDTHELTCSACGAVTRSKVFNHWHEDAPLTEQELQNARSFIRVTPNS